MFVIVSIFITSLLGLCPTQFINNNNNSGCLANLVSSSRSFRGHDSIIITWDPNMFNDKVYISLVNNVYSPVRENCFYGYTRLTLENGDYILNKIIDNTGNYMWSVLNLNYLDILNYIQISSVENLTCNIMTHNIEEVYAITYGFSLIPNLDSNFRWIWPSNNTKNIELGNSYTIEASGYYHQDRIAYSLSLIASINNFNSNTTGTWLQVDPYPLNYLNGINVPNWLNWGLYFEGINGTNNSMAPTNISVNWIVPSDPNAYFKNGGEIYTLTRNNGSIIKLTDWDVTARIITKMYTYNRLDNGTIFGIKGNCFDINNNNNCDSFESTIYRTSSFKIISDNMHITHFPTSSPIMSINSLTQSPYFSLEPNIISFNTYSPSNIPNINYPSMIPSFQYNNIDDNNQNDTYAQTTYIILGLSIIIIIMILIYKRKNNQEQVTHDNSEFINQSDEENKPEPIYNTLFETNQNLNTNSTIYNTLNRETRDRSHINNMYVNDSSQQNSQYENVISDYEITINHLNRYINVKPPSEYKDEDGYDVVYYPDTTKDDYGYDLIPGTI